VIAFVAASLLHLLTVALDIFTLKKDTTNTHINNVKLNVLDSAPLTVYQATLAGHWLVMGLKIDNSPVAE
jgi:hypothetical protein